MKIKYSDLSVWLKIGIIGGWSIILFFLFWVVVGWFGY